MSYILHSTEVQLRTKVVWVPPITMYHMRQLLSLRDQGLNIDNPDAKSLGKLLELFVEVLQENHPDITLKELEREVDSSNVRDLVGALNSLPKNSIALTGTNPEATPAQSETTPTTN